MAMGSYRDRLDRSQRAEAERRAFEAALDRLTFGERNQLANHFRFEAEGDPTLRGYIVDLIEGYERLDRHSSQRSNDAPSTGANPALIRTQHTEDS